MGSPGGHGPSAARHYEELAGAPHYDDLATVSPTALAQQFVLLQQRYRQGLPVDERVGLELFRRAIQKRDAQAWELLFPPCRELLIHWLLRHPWADLVLRYDSQESYVLEVLSKFWQATDRLNLFQENGATLSEIFAYLRRCLNSVVLDAARQARRRQREVSGEALAGLAAGQQIERSCEDLWQCIERALPDPRERRLIYLRYVLDYRPREIVELAPEAFPRVELVYQLERKVLERLRRHPALARWKA
jgi:DNA-directed RNA polymerase specialized sigma24 family protein